MNTLGILRTLSVLTLAAVGTLGVTGCSSGAESASPASGGTTSPSGSLDGTYAGRYDGDDSGPVTMTISGDDVDVVATVAGKQYPGSGNVSSSRVSVGLGAANGVTVTFEGSFGGGKGQGTWRSSLGTKGTWSVAR